MDVIASIVDTNAQSRRCRNAEPPVQRLRAVMSGAQTNALTAEDVGEIVGVDSIDDKTDAAGCSRTPAFAPMGATAGKRGRIITNNRQTRDRL